MSTDLLQENELRPATIEAQFARQGETRRTADPQGRTQLTGAAVATIAQVTAGFVFE